MTYGVRHINTPQAWHVRFWSPSSVLPSCKQPSADDAALVDHLIATLPQRLGADGRRVFLSGFSNGAMLAQEVMCARPAAAARLRATALLAPALAAAYAGSGCAAPGGGGGGGGSGRGGGPPVLVIHGTKDPTLPVGDGGDVT